MVRADMHKNKLFRLGIMSLPLFIPVAVYIYIWLSPNFGWDAFAGRGNILVYLSIITIAYIVKLLEEVKVAINWELNFDKNIIERVKLCLEELNEEETPQNDESLCEFTGENKTFEYSPLRKKITELLIFIIILPLPVALGFFFWDDVMRGDLEFKIKSISVLCAVILNGLILHFTQKFCIESTLTIYDNGITQSFGNGKCVKIAFCDLKTVVRGDDLCILKSQKKEMVIRKVYQNSDCLFELIQTHQELSKWLK